MYSFKTDESIARARRNRVIIAVALVVIAVALAFIVSFAIQSLKLQGAEALRQSIITSANQCCAIEGAYPSSLKYLEERYGLIVNKSDYIVTYEVFAENVAPTVRVTVVPK